MELSFKTPIWTWLQSYYLDIRGKNIPRLRLGWVIDLDAFSASVCRLTSVLQRISSMSKPLSSISSRKKKEVHNNEVVVWKNCFCLTWQFFSSLPCWSFFLWLSRGRYVFHLSFKLSCVFKSMECFIFEVHIYIMTKHDGIYH